MQITEINERIKVRADFDSNGQIAPLLFRRKGQETFRVTRINSSWEDKAQRNKLLYFSVNVDRSNDVFQLCYRDEDRTWRLECVMMDG